MANLSKCGCASKLRQSLLMKILGNDVKNEDCSLVSMGNINLLVSTDIGTLAFDDIEKWAEIYTLHALSDIFSSGGVPTFAVMQLGLSSEWERDTKTAKTVIKAVKSTLKKFNSELIGGHTFTSGEMNVLGLTVLGKACNAILDKGVVYEGNDLILTKPLGIGLYLDGFQYASSLLNDEDMKLFLNICTQPNDVGIELSKVEGVTSCTDVTGWGLIGELGNIITTSNLGLEIYLDNIPILPKAYDLSDLGLYSSVALDNLSMWEKFCQFNEKIQFHQKNILSDPQTNGGLLFSCAPSLTDSLIQKSISMGNPYTARIGRVIQNPIILFK